jgi:hypothetical protein
MLLDRLIWSSWKSYAASFYLSRKADKQALKAAMKAKPNEP